MFVSFTTFDVIKKSISSLSRVLIKRQYSKKMESQVEALTKQLAPSLTDNKYKGQAGRIGVFGGSLEYTGAPYFSSISSLKVGADLAHVFCLKEAAPVIKSYSPELIVHPLLDDPDAVAKIEPWLDRLHVILIGPGLGRDPATFNVIDKVIELCRSLKKPLVIDADGLFYVSIKREFLKDYPATVILTPNVVEFNRIVGEGAQGTRQEQAAPIFALSKNVTFICKAKEDEIFTCKNSVKVTKGGSGRRCGGQGDILAGSVSIFLNWSLQKAAPANPEDDVRAIVAGYAASNLVRKCNEKGFKKLGRSMTCSDMIKEIHEVFKENFELK